MVGAGEVCTTSICTPGGAIILSARVWLSHGAHNAMPRRSNVWPLLPVLPTNTIWIYNAVHHLGLHVPSVVSHKCHKSSLTSCFFKSSASIPLDAFPFHIRRAQELAKTALCSPGGLGGSGLTRAPWHPTGQCGDETLGCPRLVSR